MKQYKVPFTLKGLAILELPDNHTEEDIKDELASFVNRNAVKQIVLGFSKKDIEVIERPKEPIFPMTVIVRSGGGYEIESWIENPYFHFPEGWKGESDLLHTAESFFILSTDSNDFECHLKKSSSHRIWMKSLLLWSWNNMHLHNLSECREDKPEPDAVWIAMRDKFGKCSYCKNLGATRINIGSGMSAMMCESCRTKLPGYGKTEFNHEK